MKFLVRLENQSKINFIELKVNSFSLHAQKQFDLFYKILKKVNVSPANDNEKGINTSSIKEKISKISYPTLFSFMALAFLGGLILNVMPCVLPVISLKIFGIIREKENKTSLLKHNLSYSLGVISTLLVLATIIIIFKNIGSNIGWGFQLQSPAFTIIMIVVIFMMGLNFFELFDFGTLYGQKLGNIQLRDTFTGDFLAGVFSTILSTPCSAPFLGTALTFAFRESNVIIYTIFISIGLGLSFPFIIIGIFPSLIKFLPHPGNWMEHFRKFLGLILIITVLWLLDVLGTLTLSSELIFTLELALACIFFTFYLRKNISRNILFSLILISIIFFLFIHIFQLKDESVTENKDSITQKVGELKWSSWSLEKLEENIENKKITFIDFTAKWCLTCKLNKKFVLDTDKFKQVAVGYDIELLRGDWTRRDPEIGKWFKENDVPGVPAYFMINSKGDLINLGETISVSEIKEVLE